MLNQLYRRSSIAGCKFRRRRKDSFMAKQKGALVLTRYDGRQSLFASGAAAGAAYVRAAGFLAAWSKILFKTLLGTCSKVNGSIE